MDAGTDRSWERAKGLVIITGCDSGIGKSLVNVLLDRGYSVIQSYLDENQFENQPRVFSKRMDSRNPEDVEGFCSFAKEICRGGEPLVAVIPNSGVALGGPIENIPMSIYRDCYDINFFGTVRVIQAFIPELIVTRGRIVVNGSMAGKVALPFLSPYASSKFALEGFCDSLRRELNPFGIRTILIEPAAVATPIWNKAKEQDISFVDEKYLKSLYRFRDSFIEGGNKGLDVYVAAVQIADILEKDKPKARYIIAKNRFTSKLLCHMPSWVLDLAVVKMFDMHYGDGQKNI